MLLQLNVAITSLNMILLMNVLVIMKVVLFNVVQLLLKVIQLKSGCSLCTSIEAMMKELPFTCQCC